MFNPNTKTGQVFSTLVTKGEAMSPELARARGIGNLSAEVARIRAKGFAIYANRKATPSGTKITEYRHGKPSRALVAAGYRALAAKI